MEWLSDAEKALTSFISQAVIRGAEQWVKEQQLRIEDGKVVGYQVNLTITFVLDEGDQTDVA